MENKPTYRLFEDKVDKLVHDALVNETIHTTQHEWQSLQQRLQDYHKQPTNSIYKYTAIVAVCTTLILALLFLQNNNTNNKKTVNTTAIKNETNNVSPLSNRSTLTDENVQDNITKNNTTTQSNVTRSSSSDGNKLSTQNYIPPPIAIKTIALTNTSTPKNNFKQKDKIVVTPLKENDREDNKPIVAQSNETIKEVSTTPQKGVVMKAIDETTTITATENSTETDHLQGIHSVTDKPLPQVVTAKRQRSRKEAPQHDFSNEVKLYVEAYSGLTNSTKDKNSFAIFLAPKGLIEKRLNQEYAITTANAGVNFKLSKNHFLFSSGLSYLQFGDKVNYDSSVAGVVGLTANGKSSFTYLEIPVLAGYDWASKRWGFNLQGGLSMGVLLNTNGQYLSTNNIVVPQNINYTVFDLKKNQSTFKKSVFNLIINPQLNYFINSNTNIFVSPVYRRNLQPITVTDAEIKQKYNSFGINFGLRTRIK
jgi:Outer membrane protein beta-barrel domain